jgi:hypothetical protein
VPPADPSLVHAGHGPTRRLFTRGR